MEGNKHRYGQDKIKLFNMARPKDYNVISAVSDKREKVLLHRFGSFGLGSTIDQNIALSAKDKILDTQTIETKPLNEIINKSPFKDQQIDLLSIDAEGMDYKVLCSLDFHKYQPKIIIIESHCNNIQDVLKTDIYKFLDSRSYILRSWTFYSLIFILPGANLLKDREKGRCFS
ncbi:MAG: FkbM family methyltransferase [Bdellovibrio sp.]|nr:MAG: FkbM family methyltransferase [Bdellovibrio sp.]